MTSRPPDDRLARAKEIFRTYLGHRQLMYNDGVDREYDSYAVTAEQEARWRNELIEELVNRLSPNEVKALSDLRLMSATEVIPRLLELAPLGDSYAQLEYADTLWAIAGRCPWKLTPELVRQCKDAAIARWQSIATSPPSVSDNGRLPAWLTVGAIGDVARKRLNNIAQNLDALDPGFASNPPKMDVIDRRLLALFQWVDRGWQWLWRRS